MDLEGFAFWNLSEGAFGCCKYLIIYYLLECLFDAETCDLSFVGLEK